MAEAILKGSPWERDKQITGLAILALGDARGQALQAILAFYRDAPPEKREVLRFVLCRIGKEAEAGAPMLRAELGRSDTSAKEKVAAKVVLAAMGQAVPAEIDEIAEAISGGGEIGLEVLGIMFASGYNPWVPERVEKAIIKVLDKPRVNPDNREQCIRDCAFLVLTTFGDRTDAHVLNALEAEYNSVLRDRDYPASIKLWAGLGLAKADPGRRQGKVLSVLMEAPDLGTSHGRPLMEWMCAGLSDGDLVWVADALLSERKAERLAAALVILDAVGPRARSAVPRLVTLVRSADDDFIRTRAAKVLGMVADPSDVALIRNLSAEVVSQEDVREAVDGSVRAIQLQD
ncbi:MAG: hypothetical protein NTX87_15225 [Planctomycetota bacterium]|nr:hypothetical protein [Planctomycetota bacterium]